MNLSKNFREIKGDASFRKFYRNKKKKSIIVFANKEKSKNLLIYDAINKILIKNKVIAPKLISQNYQKNYIEIEDLGLKTIYQLLTSNEYKNYLILYIKNVFNGILVYDLSNLVLHIVFPFLYKYINFTSRLRLLL